MFGNSWDQILGDELNKDYYKKLRAYLVEEYKTCQVFPPPEDVFTALRVTDYNDVKVVILGQDPYHGEGQAHGMAFSVREGVRQPKSLVNIFRELKEETGIPIPDPNYGYLMKWAEQGVLLLNTCLTVRAHQPNSHRGKGWEQFTDVIIQKLSAREKPMVFILWGAQAKSKSSLIDGSRHLILTGAHPSPLSAYNGFFGGDYFNKTNEFLREHGMSEIDWDINK